MCLIPSNQVESSHLSGPWFVYSILSALSLCVSCYLVPMLKSSIQHSIDTIYFSLGATLIAPSFVFTDYSRQPAKLEIDR